MFGIRKFSIPRSKWYIFFPCVCACATESEAGLALGASASGSGSGTANCNCISNRISSKLDRRDTATWGLWGIGVWGFGDWGLRTGNLRIADCGLGTKSRTVFTWLPSHVCLSIWRPLAVCLLVGCLAFRFVCLFSLRSAFCLCVEAKWKRTEITHHRSDGRALVQFQN